VAGVAQSPHLPSSCVAGVALSALGRRWSPVTPRHFVWQAWHLVTSAFVLRGRQGTRIHPPSFHLRFAWQAWRGVTGDQRRPSAPCSAISATPATHYEGGDKVDVSSWHFAWQAWHLETSTFVSRGRRGTISHLPSFCVAGGALMALRGALGRRWSPVTPRHFAWQAWHLATSTFVLRARRGTRIHPPSFHLRFAWQAWHKETSTLSRPWFCVAGVALFALRGALGRRWSPVTPRHFAWQAWHLVSRGMRGTISHLPS